MNLFEYSSRREGGNAGIKTELVGVMGKFIGELVPQAETPSELERRDRPNVIVVAMKKLYSKIMTEQIGIARGIERRAETVNTCDGRTSNNRRVVMSTMEKILIPYPLGQRRLSPFANGADPNGRQFVLVHGMKVERFVPVGVRQGMLRPIKWGPEKSREGPWRGGGRRFKLERRASLLRV